MCILDHSLPILMGRWHKRQIGATQAIDTCKNILASNTELLFQIFPLQQLLLRLHWWLSELVEPTPPCFFTSIMTYASKAPSLLHGSNSYLNHSYGYMYLHDLAYSQSFQVTELGPYDLAICIEQKTTINISRQNSNVQKLLE